MSCTSQIRSTELEAHQRSCVQCILQCKAGPSTDKDVNIGAHTLLTTRASAHYLQNLLLYRSQKLGASHQQTYSTATMPPYERLKAAAFVPVETSVVTMPVWTRNQPQTSEHTTVCVLPGVSPPGHGMEAVWCMLTLQSPQGRLNWPDLSPRALPTAQRGFSLHTPQSIIGSRCNLQPDASSTTISLSPAWTEEGRLAASPPVSRKARAWSYDTSSRWCVIADPSPY